MKRLGISTAGHSGLSCQDNLELGTSWLTRLRTEAVFASLLSWTNTPGNAWRFILGGRSEPSMQVAINSGPLSLRRCSGTP